MIGLEYNKILDEYYIKRCYLTTVPEVAADKLRSEQIFDKISWSSSFLIKLPEFNL